MKKTLLLALTPLFFSSCHTDFYDGDTRTIIEGKVLYNNVPLREAEVNIYPVYNEPKSGVITELSPEQISTKQSAVSISKTKTNESGLVSVSIPRNERTSVFVIKIAHGKNSKFFGYISNYNTNNYYVNLGTINY